MKGVIIIYWERIPVMRNLDCNDGGSGVMRQITMDGLLTLLSVVIETWIRSIFD